MRQRSRLLAGRRLRLIRALTLGLLVAAAVCVLIAAWNSDLESPPPTFLLRDRNGDFLGEVGAGEGGAVGYWPVSPLPPRVVAAILVVEDHRFWSHLGVDPVAVIRAFWQNLCSESRISGASTVAMQVARLQNPGPRTYWRKLVEAVTALILTARHGREAVLEHYLRIVPFGNRVHGIRYAARRYLDKPVEDLSWAEIAFLAAIPQMPARMNPYHPDGCLRARSRAARILKGLMLAREMTTAEYELARRQLETISVPPVETRPLEALHAILRLERQFAGRWRTANTTPIIPTSLDLEIQKKAAHAAFDMVQDFQGRGGTNAAVIVLDARSRGVLAWVGSADYFDAEHAGAIDYAAVARSAGSTLKPFLYALALERGVISPSTILDDLARTADGIGNADDRFLGPLLPRFALANSRNVPAVDLLDETGLVEFYDLLRRLELHGYELPASRYGLGLVIGGLPVTLERLVRAYTVFSSGGLLGDLRWRTDEAPGELRRIFGEPVARQISQFLSDPMARLPSFPRMGFVEFGFPVAAKTGTSSLCRDAWAILFSERYLVGAWVGNADYRPMNGLTGYRAAARLAGRILREIEPGQFENLEDLTFPAPRGFVPRRLCALTGDLANPACDRVVLEWFRPGSEPVARCRAHARFAVDGRSGLPARGDTPAAAVRIRTFVDLPPRYAAWMVAEGLPRAPRDSDRLRTGRENNIPAGARRATATLGSHAERRMSITSPQNGAILMRDPETPPSLSTVSLTANVTPPSPQLVWYVDGAPFKVVEYPYTARWALTAGEHTFKVGLPLSPETSSSIRIRVR